MEWVMLGAWIVGALFLIPIVWVIIGLLFGLWVYRDAESRGMNGILWLIVMLIGSVVGLIIYMVVRKEEQYAPPSTASSGKACPHCGSAISSGVKFCPHCGKPIPTE